MAIAVALIGTRGTSSGSTVTTGSGTSTGGSGNHGFLFVSFDPGVTISSISDSKSNTYTQLDSTRTADGRSAVYWCENWTGGSSHTATVNFSGSAFPVAHLVEVTGALSSGAIDVQTGVTADSSYPITVNSGTLTQAANAVLMMCQDNRTTGGSGYASSSTLTVISAENDVASFWTSGVGYAITAATTDVAYQIDRNAAPTNSGAHLIVVKEAASGYTMTAAQGSYALTGQTANLLYSPATYTAFQTSFQSNAFQIYGGTLGSPGAYTLTAAQGSYSLSGQIVTLRGGRRIACAQGAYTLSGQAASLLGGKIMSAAQGVYAITGSTAQIDYAITASQGTYSIVGQAAILKIARQLSAAQGSYALSGQNASLRVGRGISAAQGTYTLTGQDAALTYSGAGAKVLTAEQGSYSISGQAAIVAAARKLAAATGAYTLSGQAASLLTARLIAAAQGGYSLSGQAVNLIAPKKVLGEFGVYSLFGQSANLNYSAASSEASGGWPIAAMVSEMRRRKAREAERLKALEEEERKREQALTYAKSVDAKQKARAKLEDAKAATERQERLLALLVQEIADAMRQEAEAEEEREILEIVAEWM